MRNIVLIILTIADYIVIGGAVAILTGMIGYYSSFYDPHSKDKTSIIIKVCFILLWPIVIILTLLVKPIDLMLKYISSKKKKS